MAPIPTRQLGDGVLLRLVPLLEAAGFHEVALWHGDSNLKVSGREIRLERWADDAIDCVHINFDKYRDPRLAIWISRRRRTDPMTIVRGACLTKSRRNYYDWWGKPWWLPMRLWPIEGPTKVIDRLSRIVPQLFAFLEYGERGPNIGRFADGIAY